MTAMTKKIITSNQVDIRKLLTITISAELNRYTTSPKKRRHKNMLTHVICEAVIVAQTEAINFSHIYEQVRIEFKESSSENLRKKLQNFIDDAFTQTDSKLLKELYTDYDGTRPTVGEFVEYMVEKITEVE